MEKVSGSGLKTTIVSHICQNLLQIRFSELLGVVCSYYQINCIRGWTGQVPFQNYDPRLASQVRPHPGHTRPRSDRIPPIYKKVHKMSRKNICQKKRNQNAASNFIAINFGPITVKLLYNKTILGKI